MSPAPFDAGPSPEDLVARVLDPQFPAAARNEALILLRPIIEEVAGICSRRLCADQQVREDLVAQAFTHVASALARFDQGRGTFFRSWLQGVLTHLGQDLRRRRTRYVRRHQVLPDNWDCPSLPAPDHEEESAQLARNLGSMRAELDRCSWPPSAGIDYFAVLLVLLRVELANAYRRAAGKSFLGPLAPTIAAWLPWRQGEEDRLIRRNLPNLRLLWDFLAPRLETTSGRQALLAALNETTPGQPGVSYNALAQWCFRARKMAHERLGEKAWHTHGFARLLLVYGEGA
jgi:hypothetical protein